MAMAGLLQTTWSPTKETLHFRYWSEAHNKMDFLSIQPIMQRLTPHWSIPSTTQSEEQTENTGSTT